MATSLNPYLSKFSTDFDVEKATQYRLTIQFSLGGLSFALFDTKNIQLVGLECYQSDLLSNSNDVFRTLERALDAKGLNNKTFHSVTCIVDERTTLLVPEALYNPSNNESLLHFNFNLPTDYSILSEKIIALQTVNLYGLPTALLNKIKSKWPEAIVTHSTAVMLDSLKTTEKPIVYVNVRNRDFDMAIVKDKLLFFNNFKFNTIDDFAYFLLFAMEQYGLSGQNSPIVFSGLILPSSDIVSLCARYVKDVRFVEKPNELKVGEAMAKVPYQYYHIQYQSLRHEIHI